MQEIKQNDENGFSYRGRFQNKEQAISIGYDFSQKMHNALRWMIQRQGNPIGKTMMLLAWESDLKKLPSITNSSAGIFSDFEEAFGETFDFNMDHDLDIKPIAKSQQHFQNWVDVYPFYANVKKEGVKLFEAA